jgi:hypothetical protein
MSAETTLTCRDCGQAFTFTAGERGGCHRSANRGGYASRGRY